MAITLQSIEEHVKKLTSRAPFTRDFFFDLLLAYGISKSSVTRLRSTTASSLNVAANPERDIVWKNKIYLAETSNDLIATAQEMKTSEAALRFNTRFVIATNYEALAAIDTKTGDSLSIPLAKLADDFTFFLPWANMEKQHFSSDTHADRRAAEHMSKVYDELLSANPTLFHEDKSPHSLNIFFTRLLFCFFAEDTGIFTKGQFTSAVGSHTQRDGSDTAAFLTALFHALDTPSPADKPVYLQDFPYVNGRLFRINNDDAASLTVPQFTKHARDSLLELGTLDWSEINPDIFGSMFQAVVDKDQRANLGQHYTSVPNILKTIKPLFLDELWREYDKACESVPRLKKLLTRISKIKLFDPASGSGNFLVIAYKELRKLEHAILDRIDSLSSAGRWGLLGMGEEEKLGAATLGFGSSVINIENFYGIEIDDISVEMAILSLWIAKHQMNQEFKAKFGLDIPLIPLKETGHIVHGNATRLDWNEVCPNNGTDEIYLIGNPPYVGSSMQSASQKEDLASYFGEQKYSKNLDYISLWFLKGADYIRGTAAQLAFVSTNSITQGDHVGLLFPFVLTGGIEISYAYTSFKWSNNASHNAGVTVIVLSLRNSSDSPKLLFSDGIEKQVKHINAYLAEGDDVIVTKRRQPLSHQLPQMTYGSKPTDGGHLILEPEDVEKLLAAYPESEKFIKQYVGSSEYIRGNDRFCLWIEDDCVTEAQHIPAIAKRLERVRDERLRSKALSTVEFAEQPHRFKQRSYKPTDSIIVPSVSSERRDYVPVGYLDANTVISNLAFAVYDAEPWLFALLTSKMHMAWLRAVGGQLETRLRYSNTLVYNTFPVPELSASSKEELTKRALRVLDVREYHCEKTLAELYDPDLMPRNLREAHEKIDEAVDRLYKSTPFASDEERLAVLFAKYQQMIEAEGK
ncbi:class I SAM-dependent DNA methyltransferase [Actinotignum sanguinis]|uniref:site-specific DNA-methyltransferase (adenine-specific) n=3 Tax=Actinomycetaceae TaxID=2049 RepID=A0ABZ0RAQ0_9ACTO|nr:DNA methyltransferase [Actinotignum sanguinis]MDK6787495.1 class I SAM-dependent DNA methyltransferase [Actinotignum timonense]WPJ88848.1 DNA methyltransferase [Schaalia turicensis]MDE1656471.1 class I SAM-dependent DNA methyltransferase [Actinotignum sanguinis]MDK8512479.1 class I SAM-dependent DNA methyltransferase [Actinotignum sanguinis]MDK8518658.1 class I SAM-dependent DNA methyltransferase [Actinotignum sanguinis]